MRITFVLPSPVRIPMGGAKVVYAHAQGLAARGHGVTVIGPRRMGEGWRGRAMEAAVWVRDRLHRVTDAPYYSAEGVETLVVPTVEAQYVPDADAVIATGVQTAPWVRDLPASKGTKLYFIQHIETFIDPATPETWGYPLAKITCAQWMKDHIEAPGETVLGVAPNAIDPAEFFRTQPLESRPPRVVALYHRQPIKGPDVLIETLHQLKAALPTMEAEVFAARPPSHRLPDWVQVHVRPSVEDLRGLYNRAALVLSASRSEGWGLVPMEAAACGCAVVSSANKGIQEFLTDGVSMRTAPVGDAGALAKVALKVLTKPAERVRLAEAASEAVARFTWADSTVRFEALIEEAILQERMTTPSA